MKIIAFIIGFFMLFSFLLSCQEGKDKELTSIKPNKEAGARRACTNNSISYAFVYPDTDYGYNGNGCISYYVHRGSTRQVKVKMTNAASYVQDVQSKVAHPDNSNYIQYTVASVTGGSLSFISPVPGTSNGAAIRWSALSMSAFTTYELVLNVTGLLPNVGAAENGVSLILEAPCIVPQNTECDADENLHLVLTD